VACSAATPALLVAYPLSRGDTVEASTSLRVERCRGWDAGVRPPIRQWLTMV